MNPDGGIWPSIIIILLTAILGAFLMVGDAAITNLNEGKLKKLLEEKKKQDVGEKLDFILKSPNRFFITVHFGLTLSSFIISVSALRIFLKLTRGVLEERSTTYIVSVSAMVLLLAFMVVTLLRVLPHRLVTLHPERTAIAVAKPLLFLYHVFRPFSAVPALLSDGILRLMGYDPKHMQEEVTEEEIRMMVDMGNETGAIEKSEKEMINNIFEFDDRTAAELMTHRTEITAIPADANLEEIVRLATEEGYSRMPVYEEDIDNIVGVLYVKDLLEFAILPPAEFNVRDHMRSALYVPETNRCEELFQQLKAKKLQMAIVVDEYGGTSGLVTMEDLLESIVGNIQDEYDEEEEQISRVAEHIYLIDGTTSLEDVEKLFDITFPEDSEYDTLGGYITEQLGHIPRAGELAGVTLENVRFTVVSMIERRIAKVRAEQNVLSPELCDADRQ